jgi:hypothetical protein
MTFRDVMVRVQSHGSSAAWPVMVLVAVLACLLHLIGYDLAAHAGGQDTHAAPAPAAAPAPGVFAVERGPGYGQEDACCQVAHTPTVAQQRTATLADEALAAAPEPLDEGAAAPRPRPARRSSSTDRRPPTSGSARATLGIWQT